MANQYEVLGKAPTPKDLKKLSPDEIHLTNTGNTLRFKDDSGNQLGAIAGNSSNLGFFGHANNNGRFDFYTGGAYLSLIHISEPTRPY